MRVYCTGHEIADTVADALVGSFGDRDAAIGYGILRGMGDALKRHEHWFLVDNGYFGAGHYGGNYRISYRGTQALYDAGYPCRVEYGGEFCDWVRGGEYVLVCPPSDSVCGYFGVDGAAWLGWAMGECASVGMRGVVRRKGDAGSLDDALGGAAAVVTYNSGVGWEGLRRGIPCLSDVGVSVVGSYYGEKSLAGIFRSVYGVSRKPLFDFMSSHQFTLETIKRGEARCLIDYYLST